MQLSKATLAAIEREADRRTTAAYIGRGIFGGTAQVKGGVVTGKSYFPYAQVKAKYVQEVAAEYARTKSVRAQH